MWNPYSVFVVKNNVTNTLLVRETGKLGTALMSEFPPKIGHMLPEDRVTLKVIQFGFVLVTSYHCVNTEV